MQNSKIHRVEIFSTKVKGCLIKFQFKNKPTNADLVEAICEFGNIFQDIIDDLGLQKSPGETVSFCESGEVYFYYCFEDKIFEN